jgi:hypothetical protein
VKQVQRVERLEARVAANLARDRPPFLILLSGEDREAKLAEKSRMLREQRRARRKARCQDCFDDHGSSPSPASRAEEHASSEYGAAQPAPQAANSDPDAIPRRARGYACSRLAQR